LETTAGVQVQLVVSWISPIVIPTAQLVVTTTQEIIAVTKTALLDVLDQIGFIVLRYWRSKISVSQSVFHANKIK